MKAAAAARRVQNSKDQWITLEQYCMDGGLPNGQSSLPAPPLMTQQLYSTLYSLNVPVSSSDECNHVALYQRRVIFDTIAVPEQLYSTACCTSQSFKLT
jgi:hypothetical protein